MKIDVAEYEKIATQIFKPIYSVIAGQIVSNTKISKGNALDVGCGTGHLGLAVAREGDFYTRFLDESPEMLKVANQNIENAGLKDRAETVQADVSDIPLPDGSIDLAFSRGSLFFWQEPAKAFKELWRILAPGGKTYIGGGFGNTALKDEISRKMGNTPEWKKKLERNLGQGSLEKYEAILEQAGIERYEILHDEEIGLWIVMQK